MRLILGSCITAEMLGLESLGLERYGYIAIALQDTVVCKLKFEKLTTRARKDSPVISTAH